jgi:hypothetical protein
MRMVQPRKAHLLTDISHLCRVGSSQLFVFHNTTNKHRPEAGLVTVKPILSLGFFMGNIPTHFSPKRYENTQKNKKTKIFNETHFNKILACLDDISTKGNKERSSVEPLLVKQLHKMNRIFFLCDEK